MTDDTDNETPGGPERRAPKPNPAQGANGSKQPETPITHRDQLRGMSPAEINHARREGRLDGLLQKPH